MKKRVIRYFSGATLLFAAVLSSCGVENTPLDADTRAAIDSISSIEIGKARKAMDSLCVVQEKEQLTHLIDSIKKHRLQEIEQQLKKVPK